MQLGKPGEGLPSWELILIKGVLIPMVRIFFTWGIGHRLFQCEVKKIGKLIRSLPKEEQQRQVIIDKTFAIEDHTRQFSVNMVAEHLTIAGRGVMGIIATLSQEKPFEQPVTIEGVKPFENKADQIKEFEAFAGEYEAFFKALPKRYSKMTTPHPWFVEFNNFDWAAFMYMHTFIHRRQIEEIIKRLSEQSSKSLR